MFTFGTSVALPFLVSILANFGTEKVKKLYKEFNNNNFLFKDIFKKAIISSVKDNLNHPFISKKDSQKLINKIQKNDIILFNLIETYSNKYKKNFLNILEDDDIELYNSFLNDFFISYEVDISEKETIYKGIFQNILSNFKIHFFKTITNDDSQIAIFQEVLKVDKIIDLLNKTNNSLFDNYNEFQEIKNILFSLYCKKEKNYSKNQKDYDKYIIDKFQFLELAGFSPKIQGKDIYMKLTDIFIPLSITDKNAKTNNGNIKLSIENILNLKKNNEKEEKEDLVILGDPGSGKSTLLKFIASYICSNRTINWNFQYNLPVFAKISEYTDWYKINKGNLYDFIINTSSQFSSLIKENFENSNVIVLLDGLDEITDSSIRTKIIRNIIDLKSIYPKNKYIVSSRIIGYSESKLSGYFIESKLKDFTKNEIKNFAKKWYTAISKNILSQKTDISNEERQKIEKDYLSLSQKLIDSISRNDSVIKFAKNPLLMTIVAMIFYQSKKLPNKRVELYDIATETFLDNWVRVRFEEDSKFKDKDAILEILPHIAFHMHKTNNEGLISEYNFKKEFINQYKIINECKNSEARQEFNDFKDFLEKYTGFFYRKDIQGSLYGFVHLTFEEYLCALELKSKWDINDIELSEYVFDFRWIEVIRLSAANIKMVNKGLSGRKKVTSFIKDIRNTEDEYPFLHRTFQLSILILSDDIEITKEEENIFIEEFLDLLRNNNYTSLVKTLSFLYNATKCQDTI